MTSRITRPRGEVSCINEVSGSHPILADDGRPRVPLFVIFRKMRGVHHGDSSMRGLHSRSRRYQLVISATATVENPATCNYSSVVQRQNSEKEKASYSRRAFLKASRSDRCFSRRPEGGYDGSRPCPQRQERPRQDARVSTSTCKKDECAPGAPSLTGHMTSLCSEGATLCTSSYPPTGGTYLRLQALFRLQMWSNSTQLAVVDMEEPAARSVQYPS